MSTLEVEAIAEGDVVEAVESIHETHQEQLLGDFAVALTLKGEARQQAVDTIYLHGALGGLTESNVRVLYLLVLWGNHAVPGPLPDYLAAA